MKLGKQKIAILIMIVAIIAITAVIFINSFADMEKSHNSSSILVDAISPNKNNGEIDYEANSRMELIIRKSAHLIEYAILGVAVMIFTICFENQRKSLIFGYLLFFVLLVAVVDEYIQKFSGRSSSVGDVLLDFCGAFVGFCIVAVVCLIAQKIEKAVLNRKNQA